MSVPSAGTYRSACGRLLHYRADATGRAQWEAKDDNGTCYPVELARSGPCLRAHHSVDDRREDDESGTADKPMEYRLKHEHPP